MNITRWFVSIVIILTVIAGLGFTKFTQIQAMIAFGESFPEPSASVKSSYAKKIHYTPTFKVIGQFKTPNILKISNEYTGSLTFVGFKPGDLVKQDQILLRQDTANEQADLIAAKARVQLSESTYKRVNALSQQKRISPDEVDKARANVAIAKAEVEKLAAIIDKKTIKAPFSGHVDLSQFHVGQMLDKNQTITTLVGITPYIWVDFAIPQTVKQPNIGDTVNVALSKEETQLSATIIAKNPVLEVSSRQQVYRAKLSNPNNSLSHNQIATVYVPTGTNQAVMVPSNAISRTHFGEFVYVLEKDKEQKWRAKAVKVSLGEQRALEQVVLSGLEGGEFIATEGAFKLKENILVYTEQLATAEQQVGGQ